MQRSSLWDDDDLALVPLHGQRPSPAVFDGGPPHPRSGGRRKRKKRRKKKRGYEDGVYAAPPGVAVAESPGGPNAYGIMPGKGYYSDETLYNEPQGPLNLSAIREFKGRQEAKLSAEPEGGGGKRRRAFEEVEGWRRPEPVMSVGQIHSQLQQLAEDEAQLLENVGAYDHRDIKEYYWTEKMKLIQKLPEDERARYKSRYIKRMGVQRRNVDMEDDGLHKPYFVVAITFVNLMYFTFALDRDDFVFQSLKKNPLGGPSGAALDAAGAKNYPKIVDDGQWWRIVLPVFLHAGVIHILVTTLILLRLGWSMEQAFGSWRVALIYFTSGVFGVATSCLILPDVVSVGGSAGVFGLLGALWGDFFQNAPNMVEGKCAYLFALTLSSAVCLSVGLVPKLDNFMHIGGWLLGIAGGTTFLGGVIKDANGNAVKGWYSTPVTAFAFLIWLGMMATVSYALFSEADVAGWCSWCDSLTCVETAWWSCDDQQL